MKVVAFVIIAASCIFAVALVAIGVWLGGKF